MIDLLSYFAKESIMLFTEIHHKEIDSTHKFALRELDSLIKEPCVITAECQTDGIGTKGRSWQSPLGKSISATFIFSANTKHPLQNIAQLLILSIISILKTLDFDPLFKWPNDLLLSEKKVGGAMASVEGKHVVVSCGLNVNMLENDFGKVDYTATSLLLEKGEEIDLEMLEQMIIQVFGIYLERFLNEGFTPFLEEFKNHLAYVGSIVTVDKTKGIVKGLDPLGRLILLVDGKETTLSSGTLRPIGQS